MGSRPRRRKTTLFTTSLTEVTVRSRVHTLHYPKKLSSKFSRTTPELSRRGSIPSSFVQDFSVARTTVVHVTVSPPDEVTGKHKISHTGPPTKQKLVTHPFCVKSFCFLYKKFFVSIALDRRKNRNHTSTG